MEDAVEFGASSVGLLDSVGVGEVDPDFHPFEHLLVHLRSD